MPGVATSFAQAGQDTLEQALKQRLLEQQMQQSQLQMLAQIDQRDQMNAFRQDSAMRADKSLRHRQSQDAMTRERQARLDGEKAAETAGKKREATNRRGAADMYFEGLTRGINPDDPGMLRSMSEGDVRVSMRPKEPKPTLAEELDKRKKFRIADKEVDAMFDRPKPTKVADRKLPPSVKRAIDTKIGEPGWETAADGIKSLKRNWSKFRYDHPELDLNAAEAYIKNAYGQEPTSKMTRTEAETPADTSGLSPAVKARVNKARAARGLDPI